MKDYNSMNPVYGRKIFFDPVRGKITKIEDVDVFTRIQRIIAYQKQKNKKDHLLDDWQQMFDLPKNKKQKPKNGRDHKKQ